MSYDTSQLIHEDSLLESIEDNEDVNTENSVFPQYVTALTATLPAFLSGMVLGWTSPLLDALLSGKFNNLSIDKTQMGWIGSCTVLGAMSMCIPTGFICDLIGRKRNDSTCYIFTGFSILGVVFTYFILLETKGKSIEEIQVELDQRGILLRNQRET